MGSTFELNRSRVVRDIIYEPPCTEVSVWTASTSFLIDALLYIANVLKFWQDSLPIKTKRYYRNPIFLISFQ